MSETVEELEAGTEMSLCQHECDDMLGKSFRDSLGGQRTRAWPTRYGAEYWRLKLATRLSKESNHAYVGNLLEENDRISEVEHRRFTVAVLTKP